VGVASVLVWVLVCVLTFYWQRACRLVICRLGKYSVSSTTHQSEFKVHTRPSVSPVQCSHSSTLSVRTGMSIDTSGSTLKK